MKFERVAIFRKALEDLIESLEAKTGVDRVTDATSVPEPIRESAAQLVARLGAADRLASSTFAGNAMEVARVNAMCASMRRLQADYVAYRKRSEMSASARESAATSLQLAIGDVKANATLWV